jgi:ferredoxin
LFATSTQDARYFLNKSGRLISPPPFNEAPPDCIACGACAQICPVDVIPLKEKDGVRTIWKTDYPMQRCESCGRIIAPVKQLEYFAKITNQPLSHFTEHCVHCR